MDAKGCKICPNTTQDIVERIKHYEEETSAKRKSQSSSGAKDSSTLFPSSHSKKKTAAATEGGMVWDLDACLSSTESLQSHCMTSTTLIRDLDAPWRKDVRKLLSEQKEHLVRLESLFFGRNGGMVWDLDACLSSTASLQSHCLTSTTLIQDLDAPWRKDVRKLLSEQKEHLVRLESLLFGRIEGDTDDLSSDGKDLVKLRIDEIGSCSKAALDLVLPPTAAPATASLQTFVDALLNFERVFQGLRLNYLGSLCRFMSPEASVASASAKTKTTDGTL